MKIKPAPKKKSNDIVIPDLHLALECAKLSKLVYKVESVYDERFSTSGISKLIPHYYAKNSEDTDVFVVSSDEKKYVAIAFRGSKGMVDWTNNMKISKVKFGGNVYQPAVDIPNNAKVHRGFNQALFADSLPGRIATVVNYVLSMNPDYRVLITGHSLGGSVGTLFGTYLALEKSNVPVHVLNFGCPKIGNQTFKHWVESSIPNLFIWRFVYDDDAIAHLMPESWNYYHVGYHIHLDKDVSRAFYHKDQNEKDKKSSIKFIPRGGNNSFHDHGILNYVNFLEELAHDDPDAFEIYGVERTEKSQHYYGWLCGVLGS